MAESSERTEGPLAGDRSAMEYYSQYGEDYLLYSLFQEEMDGFYVDIGAFDGIHISNSYIFERLGWRGICVEAHPDYFPLLQRNRPNSTCVYAACVGAGQPASVPFLKEELGLLSGLKADKTADMERRYSLRGMTFTGFETVEVPALTLNEILERHTAGRRRISFVSIDTEGNEPDILRSFDFSAWQIDAFVIEANSDDERRDLAAFMRARNYLLARRLKCNLIFVRRPDDANFLRYRRVDCTIADTLHPKGEQATPGHFRGRRLRDRNSWLTNNVLCQAPDQPLSTLLDYAPRTPDAPGRADFGLIHLVNLYSGPSGSRAVQEAVTASMREAQSADQNPVSLVNVQAESDPDLTPEGFLRARNIDRTVLDLGTFQRQRPLPLLFDVVERGAELAGPDDFIVYTNSDICLQPYFYRCIRDLIELGFDAITVNRRTLDDRQKFPEGSSLVRAETGLNHRGFDCFVFPKSAFDAYVRNHACLGIGGVARGLLYNMVARAEAMVMLQNVTLTYHFGNERRWASPALADYTAFNLREYVHVLHELARGKKARHRLQAFCSAHQEPKPARLHIEKLVAEASSR
jgi:FkbM family methyltransferase